nr:unnamed protein product [Callosobruchus chinensis]
MPYKCCVPGCRGNYAKGERVHVFSFPTDTELRKRWISAVHRENFLPTQNSRVCHLHFEKNNILWESSFYDERTGVTVTAPLKNPRLKPEAVPNIFPNCPSYLTKTIWSRKSRQEKLQDLDNENLQIALKSSVDDYSAYKRSVCFENYTEFVNIFNTWECPEQWFKVVKSNVVLFKVEYDPTPIVSYSVIISEHLEIKCYLYSKEVNININGMTTPFSINNIHTLDDILLALENKSNIKVSCQDNSFDNYKHEPNVLTTIINHICDLLKSISAPKCDESTNDIISFVCEQLKLLTVPKARYRYCPQTVILCSMLHTISPHCYKYLRSHSSLILPHPNTIKSICNSYLTDPTADERNTFLTYAKTIISYLKPEERHMILMIDEVHIQPYMDYKGGNIVGTAVNSNSLATTALVFMLSSFYCGFKEVIHICPVSKIDHTVLHSFIKTVIIGLEKIGFKIFCVITDNNAINSKAMSHFAPNNKLSIVYPHPSNKERPLFYLFDSVHLLKCIRNNWINSKPEQVLTYPDFETFELRHASFHSLKTLYNSESNKLLKFGYSLTLKALFPSNLERQNVNFVLKVFNSFVSEALLTCGVNINHSKSTADFINIILKWWRIVNVKTPFKGKRINDPYSEPVACNFLNEDDKVVFLNKMLNWLTCWNDAAKFPNRLTNQTYTALHHTVYGMLEIINYCRDELKAKYILLGKFQTDPLEHRFGKYRQLAGGQYNISIRQLYESEKRLRIQSLMSLKSHSGNIPISTFYDSDDNEPTAPDNFNESYPFPDIDVSEVDIEKVNDEMPVITYLAGYCCFSVLKKVKCDKCQQNLTYTDGFHVEDKHVLIKDLSRGSLKFPKDEVINIVLMQYIIFNKILENFEEAFLNITNKKQTLTQLILNFLKKNNYIMNFPHSDQHAVDSIVKIIVSCSSNTFLKNYCNIKNDCLSKNSKKRKLATFS